MVKLRDKIVIKDRNKLIFYKRNNKKHPQEQIDLIVNDIKEFGFTNPLLIDKNNTIIAGHARYLALRQLGISNVPCIIIDDLTEKQVKALRISDNRTSELAETDWDNLKLDFDDLLKDGFDTDLTGYTEDDFKDFIDDEEETEEDNFEPPKEAKYKINVGDIYQLGNHRLMCGDATSEEDVKELMDGKKADMLFTDPPYGVGYEKKSDMLGNKEYNKISGDENLHVSKNIWKYTFENIYNNLNNGASYYLTAPQGGDQMLMMMMMEGNIKCKHELIWVKPSPVFSMGRLDYDYQHEPILYGWKGSHKFIGKGEFKKSIWEIKRDSGKLHPTMKPLQLIENAINNSSLKNHIILDTFGGSGSTLIVCEQLNRKCYMMEIDPYYCSVIIERWEKLTENKAIKIN